MAIDPDPCIPKTKNRWNKRRPIEPLDPNSHFLNVRDNFKFRSQGATILNGTNLNAETGRTIHVCVAGVIFWMCFPLWCFDSEGRTYEGQDFGAMPDHGRLHPCE